MKSDDIRERFLTFFEQRGHMRIRSSSLIPAEDPTLLFVNAGMNQFKDVFLGLEQRDYTRAVSSQKCVRAGGKHNDLDNVGHTARHLTFFEMLGNFSFGDYFKEEAVGFAWDLLTREFELPADRLWITVFEDDDEAAELWKNHVGVSSDRILRMDEKDNFWQMGDTGPCGPCSELHYDFGPSGSSEGHQDCRFPCECGRYVEIWNLVFMQFDRDGDGTLEPLPNPAIDTGMGLERIAAVLQGKTSNFDTDLLGTLIQRGAEIFGVEYGRDPKTDVSLRIVADHVRSATFLISDGALPSNEGRGYVLRKIMRRAIRQGSLLGRSEPFLYTLTGDVVELMKGAYPDLVNTREYVARVVESEEERFRTTVAVAVEKLEAIATKVAVKRERVIGGKDIFKLYDTYGLPIDFIQEIASERGLELDTEGFTRELDAQRERTRESWKGGPVVPQTYESFAESGTRFLGYEAVEATAGVQGILIDDEVAESLRGKSQAAEIVLNETPFYAEGGGQVGDTGSLIGPAGTARVLDTYSPLPGLIVHKVELEFGEIRTGDSVDARVDAERRRRIAANHTGTHLLHAVLRSTLGTHVKQSGSLVAPDRLRFDYTHFQAPSKDQVAQIEATLNRLILENHPVVTQEMDVNEAIDGGAIAFFGEKYQQRVRVVSIPEISMELCGGTHTHATGDIGLFKVVSEGSVAAGVRRFEAITGMGSFERLESDERQLEGMAGLLRTSRPDLVSTLERFLEQHKALEAELARLKRSEAGTQVQSLEQTQRVVGNVRVVSQKVEDMEVPLMRELAEAVRANLGSGVVVLGTASNGKAMLVTAVSKDLEDRLHAGKIVKSVAALVGGSGGGRADFAQAGGKEPEKLDGALQEVYNIVAGLVS